MQDFLFRKLFTILAIFARKRNSFFSSLSASLFRNLLFKVFYWLQKVCKIKNKKQFSVHFERLTSFTVQYSQVLWQFWRRMKANRVLKFVKFVKFAQYSWKYAEKTESSLGVIGSCETCQLLQINRGDGDLTVCFFPLKTFYNSNIWNAQELAEFTLKYFEILWNIISAFCSRVRFIFNSCEPSDVTLILWMFRI